LLIASCLEYVEIYPVIFLLDGHAFPGYWRSQEDWENFVCLGDEATRAATDETDPRRPTALEPGESPWIFGRNFFSMIRAEVEQCRLVPLEATGLADRTGFDDSWDEGWDNLLKQSEFHSMIDVALARQGDRPVTPLPLGELV
jgi:hypothetical protein